MAGIPAGFSDESDEDDFMFASDFSPNNKALNTLTSSTPSKQEEKQATRTSFDPSLRNLPPKEIINLEDFRQYAVKGKTEMVARALDNGVAVDQVLRSGWTALMYAASSGQHEVVKLLLDSGADPNFHKELFTPLMAACASSNSETDLLLCAKYLLEKGAKVDAAERHKVTALMFVCREQKVSIVKLLIDAGAGINIQDNRGWTALMWAAYKGDGIVVRLLLEHGADAQILNSLGQKAADVTRAEGHRDLADFLEFAGQRKLESIAEVPTPLTDSTDFSNLGLTEFTELDTTLMGLDLNHLIPVFRKNNMDYDCFLRLDDEDLDRMGIAEVGDRSKLLGAVKEIHTKEWKRSSLPAIQYSKHLTCPEAAGLMSNLALHTRYMEASVAYLRDQIQQRPRILQLGMETACVHDLSGQTRLALKHVKGLHEQLKFLKNFLDKVQDRADFIPADLIMEKNKSSESQDSVWKSWSRSLVLVLLGISGGIILCRGPGLLRRPGTVLLTV